jgi:hypothetical protein
MTFNTGNGIGSNDVRDLSDNAVNLDFFANGPAASYPDRFGTPRKSVAQMNADFNSAQASRDTEFDADQAERVVEFNELLKNSAYEVPVDYVAGLGITRPTQTVRFGGELYRGKDANLPFTTTTWAADSAKFFAIGDAALRQELADPINTLTAWSQEEGTASSVSAELKKHIRVSQFGNNLAAAQKAVNLAIARGAELEVDITVECGGGILKVLSPLGISGIGTLKDCVLQVGVSGPQVKWYKRWHQFTMAGAGSKIHLLGARNLDIEVTLNGCNIGIHGQATAASEFHSVGHIDLTGCRYIDCMRDVFIENPTPTVLVFNDFTMGQQYSINPREYHFFAQQMDGISYTQPTILFFNGVATKKNAIRIQNSEWVNISGPGNIFGAGEEAILLEEAGSVNIEGISAVFSGALAIKSALRIVNSASKFPTVVISGFKGEKPSSHVIEIEAPGGWAGVISGSSGTLDENAGPEAGANQTYFGSVPLNSVPHFLVKTDATATRGTAHGNQGTHIKLGGLSLPLESSTPGSFLDAHHPVQHTGYDCFKRTVPVAGASVTIMRLEDSEGSQTTFGGVVTMVAKNAAGTKSATYQLCVNGLSITLISETGSTTGAAADDPSFVWSVSASKTLQASRKNLTAGTFDFYATCVGDVRLRA